jgi:uncharacterized protein (DUF488 family)
LNRVFTVGHSTRSAEELLALLEAHGIEHVVDVRTAPGSRRNPWFGRDALRESLARAGLRYTHLPELGGRRRTSAQSINTGWQNLGFRGYADHMQTEEFERGVERLLELAASERVAILCAEAVPWRCHRQLVADALVVRGVEVRHVLGPDRADVHELTPFARVDGTRLRYPGLS